MKSNLQKWLDEGTVLKHVPSKTDIANLLTLVDRSLKDASVKEVSSAQRFIIAYNAALLLATALLYVSGYRVRAKQGHHWITFLSILDILKKEGQHYSEYFNECRIRRNMTSYEVPYEIPIKECEELIQEVQKFKKLVLQHIAKTMNDNR